MPSLFTADRVKTASRNKLEKILEKGEGVGREITILATAGYPELGMTMAPILSLLSAVLSLDLPEILQTQIPAHVG